MGRWLVPILFFIISSVGQTRGGTPQCAKALQSEIKIVQGAVAEILKTRPPELKSWFCRWGWCDTHAWQMMNALNSRLGSGFSSVDVMHFPSARKFLWIKESKRVSHVFVVKKIEGEEIIIDPTYLQFLGGGLGLDLPTVFIGTRQGLVDLFERHRDLVTPQFRPSVSKPLDIPEFVDQTWGYGNYANSRQATDYK
jgi:hypothetical protein